MYSMNRSTNPSSRAHRTSGSTEASFRPRRTTVLTLIGASPAARAAAIPSRTRETGKSTPFIAPNTASSSESRLTVTRPSPASASGPASARSAEPLVVSVRSTGPPSGVRRAARYPTSTGRSRRTSGSPPVIRSLCTPSRTKIAARRATSSKSSTCARGRKAKSRPNTSAGMQ